MTQLIENYKNILIPSKFSLRFLYSSSIFRMSDGTDLKMYEIQAGLEEIKEEMEKIKKENIDLKKNMAFKSLMEKG